MFKIVTLYQLKTLYDIDCQMEGLYERKIQYFFITPVMVQC